MKLFFGFALLANMPLLAQDAPSQAAIVAPDIKTIGQVRYQICVAPNGMGGGSSWPTIIKIDTQTGNTWVYQMTSNDPAWKGYPFVWTYIPQAGTPK